MFHSHTSHSLSDSLTNVSVSRRLRRELIFSLASQSGLKASSIQMKFSSKDYSSKLVDNISLSGPKVTN